MRAPPHGLPRTLRPGYVGRDVAAIQGALVRAGVRRYRPTGRWQNPTTLQVKRFQKAHGLDQSGIVGDRTWAKLYRFLTPFGRRTMQQRWLALHPPRPDWRTAAVQAAWHDYEQRDRIGYTQGGSRWGSVSWCLDRATSIWSTGALPPPLDGDCSAKFTAWTLWGFLRAGARPQIPKDSVNGFRWRAGYTGTMVRVMRRVGFPRLADAVIYGGGTGHHTAMVVSTRGGVKTIGHGSESGPHYLPVGYRGDRSSYRSAG